MTLFKVRELGVLLLDLSSQPCDLGLEFLDPFPKGEAEHSHPRHDTQGKGFCPPPSEKPLISAGYNPLNNYQRIYRNTVVRYVRERMIAAFQDEAATKLREPFKPEEWEKIKSAAHVPRDIGQT